MTKLRAVFDQLQPGQLHELPSTDEDGAHPLARVEAARRAGKAHRVKITARQVSAGRWRVFARAPSPRAFVLRRDVDVSGVSGTGIVAWGCEFPDGVAVLRWTSSWPTSVVFHERGMESVRAVHGHDGRTQIVWL